MLDERKIVVELHLGQGGLDWPPSVKKVDLEKPSLISAKVNMDRW